MSPRYCPECGGLTVLIRGQATCTSLHCSQYGLEPFPNATAPALSFRDDAPGTGMAQPARLTGGAV